MKQTLIAVLVLVGIIALILLFARNDEEVTPTDGATTTEEVLGDEDLDEVDEDEDTTATDTEAEAEVEAGVEVQ